MGHLLIQGPDGSCRRVDLAVGTQVQLGRAASNAVMLDDADVSRHHAELVVEADGVVVRDLDSKNGVWVNGRRVARQALAPLDRVQLGATVIVLDGGERTFSGPEVDTERGTCTTIHPPSMAAPESGDTTSWAHLLSGDGAGATTDAILAAAACAVHAPWLALLEQVSGATVIRAAVGELPSVLPAVPGAGISRILPDGDSAWAAIVSREPPTWLAGGPCGGAPAPATAAALATTVTSLRLLGENEDEAPAAVPLPDATPPARFDSRSRAFRQVVAEALRAAPTDVPVLLTGENGTGKEELARLIHARSLRTEGPFVVLNCSAVPESLFEAELFGVAAGAATGTRERVGLLEAAHGGTLFLDEVGDLPLAGQVKLLRALQEREIVRVGSTRRVKVDVRFLAATNRPLRDLIAEGLFREDFYYRLNTIELRVPSLRERPEDILPLALRFATLSAREHRKPLRGLSPRAERALASHAWPGNVRELRHSVERAVMLADRPYLDSHLFKLSPSVRPPEPAGPILPYREARREWEVAYLRALLAHAHGNISEAARTAGLAWKNLKAKMREASLVD